MVEIESFFNGLPSAPYWINWIHRPILFTDWAWMFFCLNDSCNEYCSCSTKHFTKKCFSCGGAGMNAWLMIEWVIQDQAFTLLRSTLPVYHLLDETIGMWSKRLFTWFCLTARFKFHSKLIPPGDFIMRAQSHRMARCLDFDFTACHKRCGLTVSVFSWESVWALVITLRVVTVKIS